MDAELIKTIGGGGVAASLLFLIYLVGMRLVAAMGRLVDRIDEHTKTDVAAHGEVKTAIARLEGRIDGVIEWAERGPPEGRTPARGVRIRAGTKQDGER